ncbi:hypothetical protein N7535_003440 [Penicillium sp. DV-2018c]|nr:hypothetical protein N7461_000863 [Penicillium sp. DV-2018c]KAJ5576514.1 hypothetical protein N7535_003440 [Penicillium sp. DV-2018c]
MTELLNTSRSSVKSVHIKRLQIVIPDAFWITIFLNGLDSKWNHFKTTQLAALFPSAPTAAVWHKKSGCYHLNPHLKPKTDKEQKRRRADTAGNAPPTESVMVALDASAIANQMKGHCILDSGASYHTFANLMSEVVVSEPILMRVRRAFGVVLK